MKILFFNSPPSAGKDTAAKHLYKSALVDVYFQRFSAPLKTTFAALTGSKINPFFEVDYYEEHKEEIVPFLGVSFRQYQINLSELHFKKVYGEDVFARIFTNDVLEKKKDGMYDLTVVPDSGFDVEVNYLEKYYPLEDMALIRIHRDGCDFKKDSRSYVYPNKIQSIDITNNGSIVEYTDKIDEIYRDFINGSGVSFYNEKV